MTSPRDSHHPLALRSDPASPSGTGTVGDPAIAARLAQETQAVLADPDTQRRLADAGFSPMQMSQEQFAEYLAREKRELAAVIATAKIQAD